MGQGSPEVPGEPPGFTEKRGRKEEGGGLLTGELSWLQRKLSSSSEDAKSPRQGGIPEDVLFILSVG